MDSKDWLILKTVYEENNITRAAERLFVSQPALTHRIQQLEEGLGVKIISRWKKGIQFTAEGEYIVSYCDEMLARLRKLQDDLMNMKGSKIQGTLRIGAAMFFAFNNLPSILQQFVGLFPHIKCEIITGYSTDLEKIMQNEEVHVAFIRGNTCWTGPKKCVDIDENVCVISKEKIDLASLPNLPRISYKTVPQVNNQINEWWQEKFNQTPVINIEVSNSPTCIEMVLQGLGYAIVPSYCLKKEDNLYVENLCDKAGNLLKRKTWMLYHEKYEELAALREFISFMINTKRVSNQ